MPTHIDVVLVKHYATFSGLSAARRCLHTFKRLALRGAGRESHNMYISYTQFTQPHLYNIYLFSAKRDRPTTMYIFTHTHARALESLEAIGNIALGNLRAITSLRTVTSDLCLSAGAERF